MSVLASLERAPLRAMGAPAGSPARLSVMARGRNDARIPEHYVRAHCKPGGIDERVWAAALCTALLVAVVRGACAAGGATIALAGVIAAILTDVLSYLAHRSLDNHRFPSIPVLARIATEFQVHHARPGDVVARGWLRNNTLELCLYVALPFALSSLLFEGGTFLHLLPLFVALWSSAVPTVHAWAHLQRHPNPLVRLLQNSGLILSPRRHARHHVGAEAEFRSYALLTGWTNRLLDVGLAGKRAKRECTP